MKESGSIEKATTRIECGRSQGLQRTEFMGKNSEKLSSPIGRTFDLTVDGSGGM
jgi:hypothetical protein